LWNELPRVQLNQWVLVNAKVHDALHGPKIGFHSAIALSPM
jgi:hypothetical protein